MTLHHPTRRRLLAVGILLGLPHGPARADTDWPQRPIRIVLPGVVQNVPISGNTGNR
jgi:hypothetical protein